MTLPRTAPYSALLWIDGSRTPALVTILEETAQGYLVERRDRDNWDLPPRRELLSRERATRQEPPPLDTVDPGAEDLIGWGPGLP